MTTRREQVTAVFFSVLMVLSVVAVGSIGLAGLAVACDPTTGDGCDSGDIDGEAGDDGFLFIEIEPTDTFEGDIILGVDALGNEEPITVVALDNDGNPVGSGIEVEVTAEVDNVPGFGDWEDYEIDGGETTAVTNADSEAIFDDLIIEESGLYRLEFTTEPDEDDYGYSRSEEFEIIEQEPDNIEVTTQPEESQAGETIEGPPEVTVVDQAGEPYEGALVTVEVEDDEGNPENFESGTTEATTNTDGVAVFDDLVFSPDINFGETDNYILTFDVEDGPSTVSDEFEVVPGDPDEITILTEPEDTPAGNEIGDPPTVIVYDSEGNPIEEVDVTVSETGGYVFDSGTLTQSPNEWGLVEFDDLVIENPGEYQLEFNAEGITETSDTFQVYADDDSVAISIEPQDTTAGDHIEAEVWVTDPVGNPISNVDVSVTEIGQGYTFDSGTLTQETNDDGVAWFDDLVIETADTGYQLQFDADGIDDDATSQEFEVSTADPADLSVETQPEDTETGEVIGGPPAALLTDEFGNPTEGYQIAVGRADGGSLDGTSPVTTDGDGIATFADLVIEEPGTYQLEFDSEFTGTVTTDEFGVVGIATAVEVSNSPALTQVAGVPIEASEGAPEARALDDNGNGIEGVAVTVEAIDGAGSIDGGTTTVETDEFGFAQFDDLVIETADEGYRLEFSIDDADENVDESDTDQSEQFNVEPAAATQLVFDQQPTNTVAGEIINPPVTVEVLDEFGNLVDDNDRTVTLERGSGPGSLDGTTGQTTDAGVAEFDDISISEAGDYTIGATAPGLTDSDDSGQFTISAADATDIVVDEQPQNTVAGESIEGPPRVLVTDEFSNPVEGVEVTVAEADGYEFDDETTIQTTSSAGLAEFDDLVIETADEDYALEFSIDESDGNVEASDTVQSDTFTVESAPVHEVTATVDGDESPTVPVGTLRTITVAVEDEFENAIEGETISVDAIDDGADNVTVDGLSVGNNSVTDENGQATFTGVSFVGEVNATVEITVSAEDGTDDTMAVTLETGPVRHVTAAIDDETAPTVPVDAERNVTVTATDAGGNPVEGQPISVDVIDDGEDDVTVAGLQEGDIQGTDENGTATFPGVTVSGEVGATVNVTVSHGEGPPGEGGVYDTMTVTLDTGDVTSLAATIDGSTSPTVTAGETNYITVTATDAAGNPVEDETIAVNAISTFGDDVTISGLSRGNQESTNQNGQAFFGALTFDGEHGGTVDVSLVADNGVSTTLTATVDNPFTGFAVDITDTNSPVIEGEPLEVTATIENPGVENGTQPVEIAVGSVTHNETYTIPAGETVTETVVWDTTAGDAGEYLATVETPGHSANASVTVLPPRPQFLEGVIRDANPDTVELTLDRPVRLNDATSETAGFAVHVDGQSVELTGATAEDDQVFVDLASPVVAGQTVVVSYDGDSDNVESHDGMEAAPFEEVSIDNRIVAANLSVFDPAVDLVTDSVSVGVEVDFRAIDSHVPADADATYHWVIGDREFTTDEPYLSMTFDEPGEVTAQVTVVADGQEDTATVVMMVVDDEPPDVHLTASDVVGIGEDPGFDASDSTDNVAIANYSWDFGDGTTDEGADLTRPSHVYDDPGEYDVTVTVTDTSGNAETATLSIVVEDADESTIASVLPWLLLALVIVGLLLASYYYYRRRQTSLQ